jgi:hypothetical protein
MAIVFASVAAGIAGLASVAGADAVTFSGTVTYEGSYLGDTLFVAVLDTTGTEDVTLLSLEGYAVGSPPLSQPYSLEFDNTGVGAFVFVASFLDVDGGGIDDIGGTEVFGWYAGSAIPAAVSSAASQSGLDFPLARAEIHGTVTFAPDQIEAWVALSDDPLCGSEWFRPRVYVSGSGPYSIIGVYPGTYCAYAEGYGVTWPHVRMCFGDVLCVNPTLITLSETQVETGVDFDFTGIIPVRPMSWGQVKSRYP